MIKNKLRTLFHVIIDAIVFFIACMKLQEFGGNEGGVKSIFSYEFHQLLPMIIIFTLIVFIFLKNIAFEANVKILMLEFIFTGGILFLFPLIWFNLLGLMFVFVSIFIFYKFHIQEAIFEER